VLPLALMSVLFTLAFRGRRPRAVILVIMPIA
jgi:hypothetical protein